MKTLQGVYKAVCLEVDNQGEVVRCQVPQIFNDETVTCFDIAGGVFPLAGDEGWVVFESGFPDHPIWLAGSEGISSPDVTPGAGVIDVTAGTGIGVTGPAQHPVITNLGVVSIVAGQRVTINNANPRIPVITATPQYAAGGATDTLLAKNSATDYDTKWVTPVSLGFVAKTGDTMSGNLVMGAAAQIQLNFAGEALRFNGTSGFLAFYDGGSTRRGYMQGHSGGVTLSADTGVLGLASATGYVNMPASLRLGVPTKYGGSYGGLGWSSGDYLVMSEGTNTFVSTPSGSGTVFLRAGANGSYQLALNSNGTHTMVGNLDVGGYALSCTNLNVNNGSANLYGNNSWYFATWGGGWFMQDGTWIRATNSKNVYTAGTMQADASLNTSGNVNASACLANYGGGAVYYQRAFQCTSNGARVGYSLLPGGYATNIDEQYNNPNMNFLNTDGGGYTACYASVFVDACKREYKQDIAPWPQQPQSVGALAMVVESAWERLHRVEVVSYRKRPEIAMRVTMSQRREEARVRLDALRERRGLGAWPKPSHVCGMPDRDDYDCGHTLDDPCVTYRQWDRYIVGAIAEQLEEVFPECVGLSNTDGTPGGVNVGAMIFAVVRAIQDLPTDLPTAMNRIRELEDRIASLESPRLESAA